MNRNIKFFILLTCLFLLLAGCHRGSDAADAPLGNGSAEGSASSASQSAGQGGSEGSGDGSRLEETDPAAVLTLAQTVTFLKHLSPQALGLDGTSMDGYQIYPAESMVLVNGDYCTKLSVFSVDSGSGTNRLRGVYLLTRDKKHLYSLEQRTSKVTELALPAENAF